MNSILQSFLLVFASEMGDKTQLLALVLASRFRRPWVIMAGILGATVLNHGLASWLGGWLSGLLTPQVLRWTLAALFWGFALWILVPDKDEGLPEETSVQSAFWTTLVVFFFAEMGDKTQLATVALGARFGDVFLVTVGTTLGMLGADGLAVFLGERLTHRLNMIWIRRGASLLFAIFGLMILLPYFSL